MGTDMGAIGCVGLKWPALILHSYIAYTHNDAILLPRQLMEELTHYIYRTPANNHTDAWKNEDLWRWIKD